MGNIKPIRILRSHPGGQAFDARDSRKGKQRMDKRNSIVEIIWEEFTEF